MPGQKLAGLTRADKPPARKPQEEVRKARERAQLLSLSMVRRLEDLTADTVMKGPKCPTCGRGSLREENLKLKAIIAMLGLGAVAAKPGSEDGDEAERGPVLVFPPGTRIAVAAAAPLPDERGVTRDQPIDIPATVEVIPAPSTPGRSFPLLRADAKRGSGGASSDEAGL